MLIDVGHLSHISWFLKFKYLIIFSIAVVEGPVITFFSGFLASIGLMNIFLAYITVALGDFIGDLLYYSMGRFGREKFIRTKGHYIGVTMDRVAKLESHFKKHSFKTLFVAKFLHGFGAVTLAAAGIANVGYKKVAAANSISTAIKSAVLIVAGYYFGKAYAHLNFYLGIITFGVVIMVIILYLIFVRTGLAQRILQ